MRFRKARGKKPAVVTLTELDIVEACYQSLMSQGHKLNDRSIMVHRYPSKDKSGKKRRGKVELQFELASQ